jgi:hypothetical protein
MMLSPWGLLVAAQAEGLGPRSPRTPGGVLVGESNAQPSGTRREHEPNGCGESRYETKRGNDPVSMVHSCRSDRKVNMRMPRTVKGSFKRITASFGENHGGFNTDPPLATLDPIRTGHSSSQHVWTPLTRHYVPASGRTTRHVMRSTALCTLLRGRRNCQGVRDTLSIPYSTALEQTAGQADCLRKRRTARVARTTAQAVSSAQDSRTEAVPSPRWTMFS